MKLLLKYLKPFTIGILLSLAFLFVQSRLELRLPNYMSDIVNVGIQQSGITSATPKAFSVNSFRLMSVFMTEQEKEIIQGSYQLVEKGNAQYSKKYPIVKKENLYIMKKSANVKKTDPIFASASLTMMEFFKSANKETSKEKEADLSTADFSLIYKQLPMLEQLPSSAFQQAREASLKLSDHLGKQIAIHLTKSFYQEIKVDVDAIQTNYIINKGIMMLGVALLGGCLSILVSYNASKIAAKTARHLRRDVFSKVTSFTNDEYDRFGASSLITRTTNDITQVQQIIFLGIRIVCYAPMMGIGGILMALEKSNSMSWIIALACALIVLLIVGVFVVAMPKFKLMQIFIDKLNLVARENLNGMMVIRAFGREQFEEGRFNKANEDLAKNTLFIGRIMAVMMPIITFIMSAVVLLIVWVGAHKISESTMQIGDMMAFMQYTMQIIMAFLMITMMFIFLPRASVSIKRIKEVLDTEPSIKDPINEEAFQPAKRGWIEFNNVSFKYKGAEEDVLHNVSFKAKPGTITAIIGSTGSGKSTLVNLIPRFYDVSSGQIRVNGVDVRHVHQHTLRNVIGYIPQKGMLLSGTIASNLKYGKKEATMEEVIEAAEVAQAKTFIESLDEQYEAPIAQNGSNVSGGQKQRLSIGRALVKKPDIYIFDDSFSALDFKTDIKLRRALKQYIQHGTIILVAQRISTIMHADNIIVLAKGIIVGSGKHEQLLKTCPTYYEIATSQLSKEEL